MKKLLLASLAIAASSITLAKLPPLSDDAKAKAAEAAARTAWTGKVAAYQLCKSEDKVAASYYKSAKAAGKVTKPATATPACADPGAFAYTPPEPAKPLAAAAAPTAASPPSSKAPAVTIAPAKKS